MMKILRLCHHGILAATDDRPWWLRPFAYVGWWLVIMPKLPAVILAEADDEGEGWGWRRPSDAELEEFNLPRRDVGDGNTNYPGS